jgi:DNA-binding MarR family transcriptional regulator
MAESSVAAGQQILPLIEHLARISRRAADAAMADGSLRPRHVIALTLLGERGPMTQHAVGAALSLDPSNVVGLLNELEERGLITRRRDPADRRRHIVEVSATGADELTQTYAQLGLVEDELFKTLTCEQRSTLHELLASAVAGLSPSHEAPGSDCLGPESDCAEPAPGQTALDRACLTPDPACLEPGRARLEPDRACLEPDPPERG